VASNTTSVPEVVGDAGILVDPTNVGKMAEAVNRVLTVPGMADELRERGLARAAAFSWPRVAQATMAVYELAARA
jgi:glycosyltransferase involved in cell wall biosynthesis